MNEKAIESTIESLKCIYAIVIALSIGEAFNQILANSDQSSEKCRIQWNRLPSLFSMLVLVVPFYHGMTRYLCEMYQPQGIDTFYGRWLLIDCSVFTFEASLFFILARSLPRQLWLRFSLVVMVLLFVDIAWGLLVWKYRTDSINYWVIINLLTLPCLGIVTLILRKNTSWWPRLLTSLFILARTGADYWIGWEFYFPK